MNCSRHILSSDSHSEAGRVVSSSLTDEEMPGGSAACPEPALRPREPSLSLAVL